VKVYLSRMNTADGESGDLRSLPPSRPPSTPSAGSPRRVEPAKGTPTTPRPRTPSAPPTPSRQSTPGTRTPSAPPMPSRAAKTGEPSDSKAAREHAKCRRHPRLQLSTSTVEIRCRELRELSESSLLQGILQVCFPLIAILRQLDQLAPWPPPAPPSLLPPLFNVYICM